MNKEQYRRLYKNILACGIHREDALSLILVHKGLKDAMTIGFYEKLIDILRREKYIYEIDRSYLKSKVHGFIEHTMRVPLPGAALVKRLYIARGLAREKLKQLQSNANFDQGMRFGFPMCDVIHYCRKVKYEHKTYMEIFSDWIKSIPCKDHYKRIDFRFMGGVTKYFSQSRLILYVPHHPLCKNSLALAQRNLEILGELDPAFQQYLIEDLFRPVLLYGDDWGRVGIVQLQDLTQTGPSRYRARCRNTLPPGIPQGTSLDIRLTPQKRVEIYTRGKKIVEHAARKKTMWSYCIFSPYDSMGMYSHGKVKN